MTPILIQNLSQKEKSNLLKFLRYHKAVIKNTQMPYARKIATIDFIMDESTLGLDYKAAEDFLNKLLDDEILEYDQFGAFPGTTLGKKGYELLDALESDSSVSGIKDHRKKVGTYQEPEKKFHIWGKTQDLSQHKTIKELNITEEMIYRFLKFQIGVIRRTEVPYLREFVAEDFLKDMENVGLEQASKFLNILIEEGYNEHDQFGAFPGEGITQKGREYFEYLKKKLKMED